MRPQRAKHKCCKNNDARRRRGVGGGIAYSTLLIWGGVGEIMGGSKQARVTLLSDRGVTYLYSFVYLDENV